MLTLLQILATLAATLFAGAALYINVAEHPARMALDTRFALQQWAPSYRRAAWLQAPLALVSLLTGMAVWLVSADMAWLWAALCIGAVVPFTFFVVMPTNQRLLEPDHVGSSEARRLLQRWNTLHAARTALGITASVIYLWALHAA